MANVALHGLLGEEEPVADLAVHETFGDELQDLDLPGRRSVLRLGCGRSPRVVRKFGGRGTASGQRREPLRVLPVTGEDLVALRGVHKPAIGGSRWPL